MVFTLLLEIKKLNFFFFTYITEVSGVNSRQDELRTVHDVGEFCEAILCALLVVSLQGKKTTLRWVKMNWKLKNGQKVLKENSGVITVNIPRWEPPEHSWLWRGGRTQPASSRSLGAIPCQPYTHTEDRKQDKCYTLIIPPGGKILNVLFQYESNMITKVSQL